MLVMPIFLATKPKPMLKMTAFLVKNFEEDNPHDQND